MIRRARPTLLAFVALSLAACADCSGNGAYVREEIARFSAFVDRVELLPRGGLIANPRASEDKRVRISFLLPVRRSSISLSQFQVSTLRRFVTVTRLTYDDGSTSTSGACTSIELDLDDSHYDPDITVPFPFALSWDAREIRFEPEPGQTAPPRPTEPLEFAFAFSPRGLTGNPPRLTRVGFPNEPSPPQPGWGRAIELTDLEAIGGVDALDRVGRSFALGTTPETRVRPHAAIEAIFDRPMVAALTSLSPADAEGFDPQSDSVLPLLNPFTRMHSRTPRGLLPDTTYRLTFLSRDTGSFLPLHSGTQDATGHFLAPRYSDALISAALADGLRREDLYGDVDFTFRTGPLRVEGPLHGDVLGPPELPSRLMTVRLEMADPPPSPAPTRVEVVLRSSGHAVRASTSIGYPGGWSTGTVTQAGQTRDVRRRWVMLAVPADVEETHSITATAFAGSAFAADDSIDTMLDLVAPVLRPNSVRITNEHAADGYLDLVCVDGLSRDVETVTIAIEGGRTTRFEANALHCTSAGDGTRTCCKRSVPLGYPDGQDETVVGVTVTVADRAGNTSNAVTTTSTPDCPQPPFRMVTAAPIGRATMSESPRTRLPEVLFTRGDRVRLARWAGDRWEEIVAFRIPEADGERRFGVSLGLTHAPDGSPMACVQHGVRPPGGSEDSMASTQLLLRATRPDPRGPDDFEVRTLSQESRLTGCSIAAVPSGADRGAVVAFVERRPPGNTPDQSRLAIAFSRDSGALSIERPSSSRGRVREPSIARDASGRVHVAYRWGQGVDESGLIEYMRRETNGTWGMPGQVTYGGTYQYGFSPVLRLDSSGLPWVAFEDFTRTQIALVRGHASDPNTWSTRGLLGVPGGRSGANRAGIASAAWILPGRPFDLASDGDGGMWLAYAELGGTQRIFAHHSHMNGLGGREVVDVAGDPASVAILVGEGGRRFVLSDERRDPEGLRRASLHLFDDATGLVLQRDPQEGVYPTCASYHSERSLSTTAVELRYPMHTEDWLIDQAVIDHDPLLAWVHLLLRTREHRHRVGGVEIESFGSRDGALPDLLTDAALRLGRGALRYQSQVCVPEHASTDLSLDACEVDGPDASQPGWPRFSFPVQVQREHIQGIPVNVPPLTATQIDSWEAAPAADRCAEDGQFLTFEDGEYRCMQCEAPPDGAGTLFYHPTWRRCFTCPAGASTPVPRPITSTTSFVCRGCSDANAAASPFEAGESRYVPSPMHDQCVRCSPGTIPRPCGNDADCGPDGADYVCGSIPGLLGEDEHACVRRFACIEDAHCPAGSACTLDDPRCPENASCARACREGRWAVAGRRYGGGSADSVDFLCSPIGCHRCWEHYYCGSDSDCPANHRCMNRPNGGFDPAQPAPSRDMPYPTPMCVLRPLNMGSILETLSPAYPKAGELLHTFDSLTERFALPRSVSLPTNGRIDEVRVRITDASAQVVGSAGDRRIQLRVVLERPARIIGHLKPGGVRWDFEAEIHGSPPAIVTELAPYIFEGRLRFSTVRSWLDGYVDVGEPDCGGIACAIDNAIVDFVIGGIVDILSATGVIADPTATASNAISNALSSVSQGVGPLYEQMYEDTLLRAIFVRPRGWPVVLQHFGDDVSTPRRFAWIPERALLSNEGLMLSLRDGR